MDAATQKKVTAKYIAPIDQIELTIRMLEAAAGMKRPVGATAARAFSELDDDIRDRWWRASTAAMLYWRECIAGANQPS